MKLKTLDLQNFRCFPSLHIDFHEQLTVLAGKNGSGKSSILEAAAIAVGVFTNCLGNKNIKSYALHIKDALRKYYEIGSNTDVQQQYPVLIDAHGTYDGKNVSWRRAIYSPKGSIRYSYHKDAREIIQISDEVVKSLRSGDQMLKLPIICYYGTRRLWASEKNKKNTENATTYTRTNGYIDSIDGAANDKLMLKWFKNMAIKQTQKNGAPIELQIVTQAVEKILSLISDYKDIIVEYNPDSEEIDIIYTDNAGEKNNIPLNQMSDGYKCTLSLIADIAYRMAMLNPQLQENILSQTEGIVFIDEIDLHLHPAWQQRILNDLQTIFPKVQFIVTTHAPAVINSVRSENLRLLEGNEAFAPSGEVYGKDTNLIISGVMGGSERPTIVKELFKRFYSTLDAKDYKAAQEILGKIESTIGSDDPEVAGCHTKLSLARFKEEFHDKNS